MINTIPFGEVIKSFLDELAGKDEQFAKKYASPSKSLEECEKYIYQEAEKASDPSQRCVVLDNDVMYGLAIHYYDEEGIVVDGPKAAVNAVILEPKKAKKPKAKKLAEAPAPVDEPVPAEEMTSAAEETADGDDFWLDPLDIPLF